VTPAIPPDHAPAPPPHVVAGHILALRLFDAADRIDLEQAAAIWQQHQAGAARRQGLAVTPQTAMVFGEAPLHLTLPPITLDLPGGPVQATMRARLYDFGAIALALHVPADDLPWPGFVARLDAVDAAAGPAGRAQPWEAALQRLLAIIAPALHQPAATRLQEDYLVAIVHRFDDTPDAETLLRRIDLAALLSGERRPLSPAARTDLLRHRFSWYADDLVALTWDRAFLYDPRGESDVTDVIEVANAQLLEMRYYDELLDAELPRMYGHVAETRRGMTLLRARRYAGLARRLHTLVAEVTELTERVDNALQVTEDVYLARIYAAALEQFRVAPVTAAVNRKLSIIRETYTALHAEAAGARTELLEVAIVLLILFEIVMALVGH
jgi:hypothetical protein